MPSLARGLDQIARETLDLPAVIRAEAGPLDEALDERTFVGKQSLADRLPAGRRRRCGIVAFWLAHGPSLDLWPSPNYCALVMVAAPQGVRTMPTGITTSRTVADLRAHVAP